jgi:hypothetical protein
MGGTVLAEMTTACHLTARNQGPANNSISNCKHSTSKRTLWYLFVSIDSLFDTQRISEFDSEADGKCRSYHSLPLNGPVRPVPFDPKMLALKT